LYRNHSEKLDISHDLWILVKKKFARNDSGKIAESFVNSLVKIKAG
jgi:hypothetical protein